MTQAPHGPNAQSDEGATRQSALVTLRDQRALTPVFHQGRTAAGYRGSITNTPPALLPNTSGRYISSARVGTT